MSYQEHRLCRGCPIKALRFDSDGYWICIYGGEETPLACLTKCPVGHWKATIEGGKIPKEQQELVADAPR